MLPFTAAVCAKAFLLHGAGLSAETLEKVCHNSAVKSGLRLIELYKTKSTIRSFFFTNPIGYNDSLMA